MKKQPGKQMNRTIEEKIFKRIGKKDEEIVDYSASIGNATSVKEQAIKQGLVTQEKFQGLLDKHILDARMPAHALALSCLEAIGEPTDG